MYSSCSTSSRGSARGSSSGSSLGTPGWVSVPTTRKEATYVTVFLFLFQAKGNAAGIERLKSSAEVSILTIRNTFQN